MNKSPTVNLLAAMPFLAMITMSWALIWLLYRAYLVLQIPNDDLVDKLGLDIPPAPELILEEITDRMIRVAWKIPDMLNSVQKHLILVNGIKVCETKRSESAVIISRLLPSHIYHISVITVSAANFQTTSSVLHVRTKPTDTSSCASCDDHDVPPDENSVHAYVPHPPSTRPASPSVSPREHGNSGGGGGAGGGAQPSAKRSSSGRKSTLSMIATVGQAPSEYSNHNHNHNASESNNDASVSNYQHHHNHTNNNNNNNNHHHHNSSSSSSNHPNGSESTGNDNVSDFDSATTAPHDESQRAGSEDELDPMKLEQLASQLQALQQDNDALENHILQEEKEHETTSRELEEQRSELKVRVKEKDEVNADLRRQVSKLESVNRTVQGEKAKRYRILQQREAERQKRQEDIARWRAQLAQIEKELPRLEEEKVKIRSRREMKVTECQKRILEEQLEMKALDEEIQDKGGRIKAIEEEGRRLQGDVPENEQEPDHNGNNMETLWKAKMNNLRFQYDSLVSVYAQAQQQYHEAEEHLKWVTAQRSKFNMSTYPFSPVSSAQEVDFSAIPSSPMLQHRTRNRGQPSPPVNPSPSLIDTTFTPGYSNPSNSPSFAHMPTFFNINNGTATTTADSSAAATASSSPVNLTAMEHEHHHLLHHQQSEQQVQQSPQRHQQQQQQQHQHQHQHQQQQNKGYNMHLANGSEGEESSTSNQPMSPHADSLLPSDLKVALDFVESAT